MTLLLPQHTDDLRRSGLTDATIAAARVYSESDPIRLQRLVKWDRPAAGMSGLVFPFFNDDGSQNCFSRIKWDAPRPSGGKYEQPLGEVARAYFPPSVADALNTLFVPLGIVEGEKKALACCQTGLPTIGVTGIAMWAKGRTDEEKKAESPRLLIADLAGIEWFARPVWIGFDSDPRHNPDVSRESAELARALEELGAEVTIVQFPHGPRDAAGIPTKMAADDYLVSHGPAALRELIESQMQPPEKARTVEDFQGDLAAARLDSLTTGRGVVNLDRSPTGSGKSTADLPAMTKAGSSLTILATHKNCQEAEKVMRAKSMLAAAFPKLDEETCANMIEAARALGSGLSVSGAICPTCPHKQGCVYLSGMREADAAEHSIATHHRASLSFSELSKGRSYIAVHEDPGGLLRPSIELSRGLEEVYRVAHQADLEENEFRSETRLELFYAHLKHAADALQKHLASATATGALPFPPAIDPPPNADAVLYRAMKKLDAWPDADAMRLCKYLAAGDVAELTIRVDATLAPGKATVLRKSIVAFRQTLLPEQAVIWIGDATADADEIASLSNLPVIDRTPGGSIRQQHPTIQVPIDLTKGTGRKTFVKVLSAVITLYPTASRIGIIADRNHVPAITGTAKSGDVLPEAIRSRIAKVEHYRSGEGRGSNAWTADCDLLIVAGTPRVPPSAIKTRLLRRGMATAAGRDEKWTAWGADWWSGRTVAGRRITIKTLAYRDLDWRAAYAAIVKAELNQCVGRGRSIRENGIPTVVITTENLSLPIIDQPVFLLTDAEEKVFATLKILLRQLADSDHSPLADRSDTESAASDQVPNIYIAHRSVASSQIAASLGIADRVVRRVLVSLERKTFIKRIGQRGGWTLAEREDGKEDSSGADPAESRDAPAAPVAASPSAHPSTSQEPL